MANYVSATLNDLAYHKLQKLSQLPPILKKKLIAVKHLFDASASEGYEWGQYQVDYPDMAKWLTMPVGKNIERPLRDFLNDFFSMEASPYVWDQYFRLNKINYDVLAKIKDKNQRQFLWELLHKYSFPFCYNDQEGNLFIGDFDETNSLISYNISNGKRFFTLKLYFKFRVDRNFLKQFKIFDYNKFIGYKAFNQVDIGGAEGSNIELTKFKFNYDYSKNAIHCYEIDFNTTDLSGGVVVILRTEGSFNVNGLSPYLFQLDL
jgi:hypothetical protein